MTDEPESNPDSKFKIKYWPYRLTVRTSAFQAGNPGSIPGRVTKEKTSQEAFSFVTLSNQTALIASGNRKAFLYFLNLII